MFSGKKVSKLSRCTPLWLGGGGGDSSYSFLTSAPVGGEWSASRPGREQVSEAVRLTLISEMYPRYRSRP
jgi:hypothetical protein